MFIGLMRSVVLYFFLILIIRLMGKRQLGEMEPSEFVVSMLIADLAASPMQEIDMPISTAVIPIVIVFALELLLSTLAYHYILIRKLFCGKPVILMEDGKILSENLRRTRVTPDELTEHLREKGIVDLSTVKYAILETNGQISALPDSRYAPVTAIDLGVNVEPVELPFTLISNGRLIEENLKLSGKTKKWLDATLKQRGCTASQVLLLTVDRSDRIYISIAT